MYSGGTRILPPSILRETSVLGDTVKNQVDIMHEI